METYQNLLHKQHQTARLPDANYQIDSFQKQVYHPFKHFRLSQISKTLRPQSFFC